MMLLMNWKDGKTKMIDIIISALALACDVLALVVLVVLIWMIKKG